MIKNQISFTALLFLFFFNGANGQELSGKDNLKFIDPTIGNVGHLLQPTRPTVHLPNQMIRVFPQRADYMSDQISSFPLNIVSHRLGEVFSLQPLAGKVSPASWKIKQTYDHDLEINRPWYYSTYLVDQEVKVQFVPGKKTGIYKFQFSKESQKGLLFGVYNDGVSKYNLISSTELTGLETYHGNIKVFMYGKFSKAVALSLTSKNKKLEKNTLSQGEHANIYIELPNTETELEFRYAISYISEAQAKANFLKEMENISFSQVADKGEKEWAAVINRIHTSGGTESQNRSFYTALYRTYERMVDITEDGHYYSGFDNKVHQTSRPFFVDDWVWDTYLALHPLRTILDPKKEEEMLNSYVEMYKQGGWMPTFPVLFGDHACMNGFHSTITFLDAYRKGLKNFDLEKAYEGMKKNATEATMLPWENGEKGTLEDFYYKKGYFPALHPGEKEKNSMVHPFEKRQAVAITLGHSYDDWALGELAKELNKTQDFNVFNKRSNNYKNLWNPAYNMFMPKDNKGNWIAINPKVDGGMGARDYYDENNGWTYKWQVQHDINGLMNLIGGKTKFESQLDQLFREDLGMSKYAFWAKLPDATGLVGQFSMGNEPSFHIPYLYNYTNSPWKTQKRIRFLLDTWYKDDEFGIPGDEDGGGMTAFVVFSSMGFYPITPGIPVYTIGSPVFEKVAIDLPNNKQFKLIANHASVRNKYIQSAKLNGKPLMKPFFTHKELMEGATVELEMGPLPNKKWGVMP